MTQLIRISRLKLEQEKLKDYSKDYLVTENETLSTKLQNKLVKIIGKRPHVNRYLNDIKVKRF